MDDIVQEGLHMLKDNRIYVTSSDKISINCHIFDLESVVDLLTVYPVGMGGDYYGFSLPGSSTVTIYLLPLERTNETISETHHISIIEKQNNKLKTIKQNMKAGSLWQFTAYVEKTISVWIRDQLSNTNTTKVTGQRAWNNEIARLMVIVSIRNVSIQGVAKKDFGCFMPTPMIVDRLFFFFSFKLPLKYMLK
uniref:Bm1548 n=1 Tax=Brugia malayi TaxID=6279 RepID=A0A0J9Y8T6_BRUMA|nr:Bm1548 [Brugia malayi]